MLEAQAAREGPEKILLIDHDTRVTHVVRRALKTAGKYSIREEHDAAFAIHAARWFCPDLVMINVTTSATDGRIIANQLQKDGGLGEVPLVCLSNFVLQRQFLLGSCAVTVSWRPR